MSPGVPDTLAENACASIRYRLRKEVLGESPHVSDYLDEILEDRRVRYVMSWPRADGFVGEVFHGGWIPAEKRKYSTTGAESGLRFLAEMGVPETYPAVERGLQALLRENWNAGRSSWNSWAPGAGLYGDDYLRAVVFAYYGVEGHGFVGTEIEGALDRFDEVLQIRSFDEITGRYRDKLYFSKGIALPDIYHLRLLAFTRSWRSRENVDRVAEAVGHLISLSPMPGIYVKYRSQLIAPAAIFPRDLDRSLHDFRDKDWFPWLHTMELFARMGIVKRIPQLARQAGDLKAMLETGDGPFCRKPADNSFRKWSVYTGLALEEDWKGGKWKYDLTFRTLLILKYADLLR
jgi:hypothetical protein